MKQNYNKHQAWWWALPMLMLVATPACSDSDNDGGGENSDPTAATALTDAPLTVTTDAAALAQRVTNYRSGVTTRATAEDLSISEIGMPKQPTVPEDAVLWSKQYEDVPGQNIYDENGNWVEWKAGYTKHNGDVCYVPAGESYTPNHIVDATVYVQGEVTLTFGWTEVSENLTIYVLDGGTLNLNGTIPQNVTVYVYGTININTEQVLNSNVALGARLYVSHDLDLGTSSHNITNGLLFVDGALTGQLKNLNNTTWVIMGCDSHITSDLNVNSYSAVNLRGNTTIDGTVYMSSGNEEFDMLPGTVLTATEIQMNNDEVYFRITGDGYAYIVAGTIASNHFDLTKKLNGCFAIQCDNFVQNNNSSDVANFDFVGQVLINDQIAEKGMTIPDYCPGNEPEDTPETPEIPTLISIAEITPPDTTEHHHPISATCIQTLGDKIYVSWHWRGVNYHGCVEIGEISNDACKLDQFFETAASKSGEKPTVESEIGRDFNHIMVDPIDNRIYVVGNEYRGGLLGYVNLNADGLVDDGANLSFRRLWGGDGNCIIRNGDYLQVATTYGYEVYTLPDLTRAVRNEMSGRSKFITKDDSRIVGMHYAVGHGQYGIASGIVADKEGTTIDQVDVIIDEFPANDYLLEGRTEIHTSSVAPTDGKNVVKLDGSDIYLCRGAYGIARFGANPGTFALPNRENNIPQGYANGIDVDDQYIYIAYGSAGLYVVDKNTLEVVAHHSNTGGKSANYVKVANGYIYVAYGESGWHVYQLTTVKA